MGNRVAVIENIYDAPADSIRTVSGLYMNVFDPKPEMICIEDIAHALSHQCRFGGHLAKFYSVAQHSMTCCAMAKPEDKFAALMHDASEAYLLDIPTPIKARLSNYKEIEAGLMKVISEKFGFQFPLSDEVHRVDKESLECEWSELMIKKGRGVYPLSSKKAKQQFLQFFNTYKN